MVLINLTSSIWLSALVISFIINCIFIKFSIPLLKYINTIDTPNSRSSHTKPTPKGIGLVIIISLFILQFVFMEKLDTLFLICLVSLTGVSFINDYKQLSAFFRIIFQTKFFLPHKCQRPVYKDERRSMPGEASACTHHELSRSRKPSRNCR